VKILFGTPLAKKLKNSVGKQNKKHGVSFVRRVFYFEDLYFLINCVGDKPNSILNW